MNMDESSTSVRVSAVLRRVVVLRESASTLRFNIRRCRYRRNKSIRGLKEELLAYKSQSRFEQRTAYSWRAFLSIILEIVFVL